MNKLTIEEQYLTLSQSKELQELGIDFSGANWEFTNWRKADGTYTTEEVAERGASPYLDEYVDGKNLGLTLSVAEMIEMLPKEITPMEDGYLMPYSLMYDGQSLGYMEWWGNEKGRYKINILEEGNYPNCEEIYLKKWNLRDALFEMLKWLKQNKFI